MSELESKAIWNVLYSIQVRRDEVRMKNEQRCLRCGTMRCLRTIKQKDSHLETRGIRSQTRELRSREWFHVTMWFRNGELNPGLSWFSCNRWRSWKSRMLATTPYRIIDWLMIRDICEPIYTLVILPQRPRSTNLAPGPHGNSSRFFINGFDRRRRISCKHTRLSPKPPRMGQRQLRSTNNYWRRTLGTVLHAIWCTESCWSGMGWTHDSHFCLASSRILNPTRTAQHISHKHIWLMWLLNLIGTSSSMNEVHVVALSTSLMVLFYTGVFLVDITCSWRHLGWLVCRGHHRTITRELIVGSCVKFIANRHRSRRESIDHMHPPLSYS